MENPFNSKNILENNLFCVIPVIIASNETRTYQLTQRLKDVYTVTEPSAPPVARYIPSELLK